MRGGRSHGGSAILALAKLAVVSLQQRGTAHLKDHYVALRWPFSWLHCLQLPRGQGVHLLPGLDDPSQLALRHARHGDIMSRVVAEHFAASVHLLWGIRVRRSRRRAGLGRGDKGGEVVAEYLLLSIWPGPLFLLSWAESELALAQTYAPHAAASHERLTYCFMYSGFLSPPTR